MRPRYLWMILIVLLVVPRGASAGIITFSHEFCGRLLLSETQPATIIPGGFGCGATLTLPDGTRLSPPVDLIGLNLEFTSGDPLGFTKIFDGEGVHVETIYRYATGHLTIGASWLEDGTAVSGHFVAEVPDPIFHITGENYETFPFPHILDSLVVGPGEFDRSLARFLGVRRLSPGGLWFLHADDLNPGEVRGGIVDSSTLSVETAVPEPLTMMLMGIGGIALTVRRRFTRR